MMSLQNCKKVALFSKFNISSSRFKLLTVLKQLHGTRGGARGSTIEEIAMYMVKYYNWDGDVKSQILATLKNAVRLNFVHKRKDRFSLVLPAAALQLAPPKFKADEIERTQCIFPVAWSSINFSEGIDKCGNKTCKRKTTQMLSCCDEEEESNLKDSHQSCPCKKKQAKKPMCSLDNVDSSEEKDSCNPCAIKKKKAKKKSPCAPSPPACSRKKPKRSCNNDTAFDDYCLMCPSDPIGENYCDDACARCRFDN